MLSEEIENTLKGIADKQPPPEHVVLSHQQFRNIALAVAELAANNARLTEALEAISRQAPKNETARSMNEQYAKLHIASGLLWCGDTARAARAKGAANE